MQHSVFLECESYMKKAAAEGRITRFRQKSDTADAAAGYLSMVEGLQELLKVRSSRALELELTGNLVRLRTASVG